MELKSLNTSCGSHFYFDKEAIHYENPTIVEKKDTYEACNQEFSITIPTHLKNRTMAGTINLFLNRVVEMEPNRVYTIESLLNYDFIGDMLENRNKYGTGYICALSIIRDWLLSIGLMNKYDKEFLSTINFEDSDFDVDIDSLELPNCIKTPLNRAGLNTLYKLLLIDYYSLENINLFGPAYMDIIVPAIKKYGYTLNDGSQLKDDECNMVVYKRNAYTGKMDLVKAGDRVIQQAEMKKIMAKASRKKSGDKNGNVR